MSRSTSETVSRERSSARMCRECLGQVVRKAWSEAVMELIPNAPRSWANNWENVPEVWKEINRRVGEAVVLQLISRPQDGSPLFLEEEVTLGTLTGGK